MDAAASRTGFAKVSQTQIPDSDSPQGGLFPSKANAWQVIPFEDSHHDPIKTMVCGHPSQREYARGQVARSGAAGQSVWAPKVAGSECVQQAAGSWCVCKGRWVESAGPPLPLPRSLGDVRESV